MGRRKTRGPLWVAVACVGILAVWWTHQRAAPTGQDAIRGITVHANTSNLPLTVVATHSTWNNRPLYRLKDVSKRPLSYLEIYSWSNEPLPIVWSGNALPTPFPQHGQVAMPPVTVLAGQSAWFELGEALPQKVTVVWRQGNHAVYEALTIR
ncbi:hypothetical protein [Alicyclobacillus sp. ALC3]|uniref:hypothetical protein n=1 Tax=Alicyclobacillus sp. ALC3 TaxID=2796143 RepID=UPI00237924B7|nr:hypothetical protein [Alicyclobacillus sp. ALC3]WDL98908.1 hypothetical protein JC200_09780 [Alicyclobacillus sp. ALC3]